MKDLDFLLFIISYHCLLVWHLARNFNDFIAYFVLLVQRPLKVGDYIQLNDEVKG